MLYQTPKVSNLKFYYDESFFTRAIRRPDKTLVQIDADCASRLHLRTLAFYD